MDARRFCAYCVLASWITLTPVVISTAIEWSTHETLLQVTMQQQKDAEESAGDKLKSLGEVLKSTPTSEVEAERRIQSEGTRLTRAYEDLGDKVLTAYRTVQVRRREFWWQFAAWATLTLLGSGLLAKHKEN